MKYRSEVMSLFEIQSDSGGICNTLGNDSMCDSKQKSLYEHGSDFERMVHIFFLPYLGSCSKSVPCSYEILPRITHTTMSQSIADSSCITLYVLDFLLGILNGWS